MVDWQKVESWIRPYGDKMSGVADRGLTEQEILQIEHRKNMADPETKFVLPEDFKEFHQRFSQAQHWRIGKWVLLPLEEALSETSLTAEFTHITDYVCDDNDQLWDYRWLVFAREVHGENLMALNMDINIDLDSIYCPFSCEYEVLRFESEDKCIAPMKMRFGRWIEKLARKIERKYGNQM
ncbi:MAG: SMI1/KNR4 family protein [Spirulina sp. SIO3F2]|nr:SMI1/KNR4 family protein [Spirulina sp. SIO3F2]